MLGDFKTVEEFYTHTALTCSLIHVDVCVVRSGRGTGSSGLREPRFLLAVCPRHHYLELRWTHRCSCAGESIHLKPFQ